MSNKAEPTVRWGVTVIVRGVANRQRLEGVRGHVVYTTRQEALAEAASRPDLQEARIVKLTRKRKPKPKVVRVKTMTWRDDGVRPVGTGSGPGVYWIGNFIQGHDDVSFKDKAMYRITIEELES